MNVFGASVSPFASEIELNYFGDFVFPVYLKFPPICVLRVDRRAKDAYLKVLFWRYSTIESMQPIRMPYHHTVERVGYFGSFASTYFLYMTS